MAHSIRGETQGRQDARMQDGLDGPQVRSLLNAVRGGEVHAGDDGPQLFTLRPPPTGRISVESHDFRRPDRLGKEALRPVAWAVWWSFPPKAWSKQLGPIIRTNCPD